MMLEQADKMDKLEKFLSNEDAVIEAIETHCVVMKYLSLKKHSTLSKDFCVKAYKRKASMSKDHEVANSAMMFTAITGATRSPA